LSVKSYSKLFIFRKKDANRMFVVILKDIADFVFIVILCEITEEKKTQTN
jgi:hypothetical protein